MKWLEHWSKDVDRIVVCGDFWDRYFCGFDEFVNSQWKESLFPLLKSKNTFYIYGNHDPENLADSRVENFSKGQGRSLGIKIGDVDYNFEHGDRLYPFVCTESKLLGQLGHLFQTVGLKLFGQKFFSIFTVENRKVKRKWGDNKKFLVCGHTHWGDVGDNYLILEPSGFGFYGGLLIEDEKLVRVKGYDTKQVSI